jgi:hypothetical protein
MIYNRSVVWFLTCACCLLSSGQVAAAPGSASDVWPSELRSLVAELKRVGYTINLSKPPIPGAYGATNTKKKIIWVEPITKELGIFRQTFLHEAVHAAQGCPSGRMRPIGWEITLNPVVQREIAGIMYRNYAHNKFPLEREAFGMQGKPSAPALILQELKKRCRP